MRLPHSLLHSPFFQFGTVAELCRALDKCVTENELVEVERLSRLGLPPAASRGVVAAIFGLNPGIVWSFESKPTKHYRRFEIPKGKSVREIYAPRVGLKLIQKWLSVHLQAASRPGSHVFGFVPGRSHIQAASVHLEAAWIYSVDVKNFFPSTPQTLVRESLKSLGYAEESAEFLSKITCLFGGLAQGAPSSPVLSNLCFEPFDVRLRDLASAFGVRLTRYADDIVFSGVQDFPRELPQQIVGIFSGSPWQLATHKTELSTRPQRLKVHGLLVEGRSVRLTKGYRNKIRAYRHVLSKNLVKSTDRARIAGHVNFANMIDQIRNAPES